MEIHYLKRIDFVSGKKPKQTWDWYGMSSNSLIMRENENY